METAKKSWLDFEHPEYTELVERWNFSSDMYTGEALDPDRVSDYLIMKSQSESTEAFLERTKLADLTPHYSVLVDSLAGMLFSVEEKANRRYMSDDQKGLGDPEDPITTIGRLYQDADGDGTGWLTIWRQLTIILIHSQRCWVVVDTKDSIPIVRTISPAHVPNWRYDKQGLAEALVREQVDPRGSLKEQPGEKKRFVLYGREGWKRYERVETDKEVSEREIDAGEYQFTSPDGSPALPIFMVKLPIERQVGWLMAKKAAAIFNKESERDNLIRSANFPFLNIWGDDDIFKKVIAEISKGTRALQNDPENSQQHDFIAPDSGPAEVSSKVLERKVDEFYITGFRQYGDSAKERTATEVRQDVSAGVGAFLQMLKVAVDDAENGALWRVEQIQYPNDKSRHNIASVERSSDFVVLDPQSVADRVKKRYFGEDEAVPVGSSGLIDVAKQLAAFDGVTINESELTAAIHLHSLETAAAALGSLPIPAEARAEFTVKLLVAVGFIDPEELVELEGGEKKLRVDVMREQALVLALAEDQRSKEFLSGGTFSEELESGD